MNVYLSVVGSDCRCPVSQGGVQLHENALQNAGLKTQQIRKPNQLNEVDSLVIPGGSPRPYSSSWSLGIF